MVFLNDCKLVGEVSIINNEAGKPIGEAVVKVATPNDLDKALACTNKVLLGRSVVIRECNEDFYQKHMKKVGKVENEENTFIRLRGLAWSVTEEDIVDFLNECNINFL